MQTVATLPKKATPRHDIHTRLTPAQHALARASAEVMGLTLSAYYAQMVERQALYFGLAAVGAGEVWSVVGGSYQETPPTEEELDALLAGELPREGEEPGEVSPGEEPGEVSPGEEPGEVSPGEEPGEVSPGEEPGEEPGEGIPYGPWHPTELEGEWPGMPRCVKGPPKLGGLAGLLQKLRTLLPFTGYLLVCSLIERTSVEGLGASVEVAEYHLGVVEALNPAQRATYHHTILFA